MNAMRKEMRNKKNDFRTMKKRATKKIQNLTKKGLKEKKRHVIKN